MGMLVGMAFGPPPEAFFAAAAASHEGRPGEKVAADASAKVAGEGVKAAGAASGPGGKSVAEQGIKGPRRIKRKEASR